MVHDRDCCVWSREYTIILASQLRTKRRTGAHMRKNYLARGNTPPFVNAPFWMRTLAFCIVLILKPIQLVSHSVISIKLGFYGGPNWPGAPVPLRGL